MHIVTLIQYIYMLSIYLAPNKPLVLPQLPYSLGSGKSHNLGPGCPDWHLQVRCPFVSPSALKWSKIILTLFCWFIFLHSLLSWSVSNIQSSEIFRSFLYTFFYNVSFIFCIKCPKLTRDWDVDQALHIFLAAEASLQPTFLSHVLTFIFPSSFCHT